MAELYGTGAICEYTLRWKHWNPCTWPDWQGPMMRADRSQLPFPERVALVVERIPEGFVTTYGRIAAALGSPKSARMVGWALNGQVDGRVIPAHRVVNRAGVLSGAPAFGAPDRMRQLLEAEDVPFLDEITVDLDECLWDPADDPAIADLFRWRGAASPEPERE